MKNIEDRFIYEVDVEMLGDCATEDDVARCVRNLREMGFNAVAVECADWRHNHCAEEHGDAPTDAEFLAALD